MAKVQTVNPATEEALKEYSVMSEHEVTEIAEKSNEAFKSWRNISMKERSKYFIKLSEVLKSNKKEYGELMAREMGKPVKESIPEVEKCALLAEVLAEKAEVWLKEEKINADGKEHLITFEPLGVVFIIMPWNFPFWQAFKVSLPPLMAGNTIIMKHASNVTGSSLAIEDCFRKAGFPENVFRSIIANHEASSALIKSNLVAACSLTGSVGAGSKIAEQAGREIKKVVLELGGSDPHVVLEDADIEKAVQGAVKGRTSNAGQVCIGSKRFIVHKKVADEFSKKFAKLISNLKVGDPLDHETDVGPLVNEKAVRDMEAFVEDAVKKGAKVAAGGKKKKGKGFFFEPTVLVKTSKGMDAVSKETFGPIAPIIIFENDEEAVKIANSTEFGLNASVWTKDLERGKKLARKIECGGVFINSVSKSHPLLPLGGIKKSGFGRELSHYGIKEFVNIKTINVYD